MSLSWISSPIYCEETLASTAISPDEPLLSQRTEIAFRASLLYNAWQAHACDGRQMSYDNIDRMEDFQARFTNTSLDENSFRRLVDDFGDFIPEFLAHGPANVPKRALDWTKRDADKPLHPSGGSDGF